MSTTHQDIKDAVWTHAYIKSLGLTHAGLKEYFGYLGRRYGVRSRRDTFRSGTRLEANQVRHRPDRFRAPPLVR